jgi:hypothetical protein
MANRGKHKQRDRVQEKYRHERDGNLMLLGADGGRDGGDGTAATDRRADGNEQ